MQSFFKLADGGGARRGVYRFGPAHQVRPFHPRPRRRNDYIVVHGFVGSPTASDGLRVCVCLEGRSVPSTEGLLLPRPSLYPSPLPQPLLPQFHPTPTTPLTIPTTPSPHPRSRPQSQCSVVLGHLSRTRLDKGPGCGSDQRLCEGDAAATLTRQYGATTPSGFHSGAPAAPTLGQGARWLWPSVRRGGGECRFSWSTHIWGVQMFLLSIMRALCWRRCGSIRNFSEAKHPQPR